MCDSSIACFLGCHTDGLEELRYCLDKLDRTGAAGSDSCPCYSGKKIGGLLLGGGLLSL